jgi:ankyrin repeat protein
MGVTRVGDIDTVMALLESGATNDHVNKRGNTALHFAIRFGFHEIVVRILDKFPHEIERKNVRGDTPLSLSFEHKKMPITEYLLQKYAKNPIYHWLMTQGKIGVSILPRIENIYDLQQVRKNFKLFKICK